MLDVVEGACCLGVGSCTLVRRCVRGAGEVYSSWQDGNWMFVAGLFARFLFSVDCEGLTGCQVCVSRGKGGKG